MAKKKTRSSRIRQSASSRERMAFPILLVLVMSVIVFGMFFYTGLLVLGSVIFVGFFGWQWWKRHSAKKSQVKKKTPARRKSKPRAR